MGNDVQELLNRVDELPPLPAVAAKVMAMAEAENASALDLAQVLSADQAFTAKRIKISNSAFFGFARKVSTVREAVVELARTGYDHQAIGRALGEGWKFPGHLVDAVARHHERSQVPATDGLAGVVAQADRLILHYGLYCGYDIEGDVPPMPRDLAEWEEACGGIDRMLERSFAFIESASGKPQRWFEAS